MLHTISFLAFVLLVLLTVWVVLVLESGGHRSRTSHEAAQPSDEPGEAAAWARSRVAHHGARAARGHSARIAGYRPSASR